MEIRYFGPLARAWRRARALLFAPFRAEFWIGLGFTAWLAGLVDAFSALGHAGFNISRDEEGGWGGGPMIDTLGGTWQRILAGGAFLWLAIMVGFVLFAFWLVLAWASARGKFMFLENVVYGRAAVADPWRRHARLGNSLLLWQVGYGLAFFVVLVAAVITSVGFIVPAFAMTGDAGPRIGAVIAAVALFGLLILFGAFIGLIVEAFVIPIMLRHECGVLAAWRRFLPLLRAHPGDFLLYGVFVFFLSMLGAMALVIAGFSTCCVGFLLLSVPFLGTLVLLPFHVTYRALGVEFLAQFGADFAFDVPGMNGGEGTPPATAG